MRNTHNSNSFSKFSALSAFARHAAVTAALALLALAAIPSDVQGSVIVPSELRINTNYDNIFSLIGYDAVAQIGLTSKPHGLMKFEDGVTIVPSGWRLWVLDDGTTPAGWDPGTPFLAGHQPRGVLDTDSSGSYSFSSANAIRGDKTTTPTVDEGATIGTPLSLVAQRLSDSAFFAASFISGRMMAEGYQQISINDAPHNILVDRTQSVPALSHPIYGDANEDGVVDAADYITLKQHFGMSSGALWTDGDFDEDGSVDYDDLQILISALNGTGSGSVPAAITPEPATIGLLGAGVVFLSGLRNRGRRRD